jgi:glycosyltransferase involved in cell wall biosynthesis
VPSKSTGADLKRLGFTNVNIVNGAADISAPRSTKENAIIYLGRLTKSKQVDHVINAFRIMRKKMNLRLWIVGRGPEEEKLKELSEDLPVTFFGFVGERKKAELLSKASLMLFPAKREGWGLVVLEANACATPVIGYDVHGLRDSIRNGVNGYTVPEGDYVKMAESSLKLLGQQRHLLKLSSDSVEYSRNFNWEKSAKEFSAVLERAAK